MPYDKDEDDDMFVGYKEKNYLTRLQEKCRKSTIFFSNQLTPKILEQAPFKLHISLTADDYSTHQQELIDVVLSHLEQGTIVDFKVTNVQVILKRKLFFEEFSRFLKQTAEDRRVEEKWDSSEWRDNYFKKADHFFGRRQSSVLSINESEHELNKLEVQVKNLQRLLDSDQVTIYIPEHFDKEALLALCQEINAYLKSDHVSPGEIADIESPIGDYINLKQDYLQKDFAMVNDSGLTDSAIRIDTVCDQSGYLDGRRQQVKKEQDQSPLYQFLMENLQMNSRPSP